jgi:two-component system, OmpR family, sensor histidine kinase AdeS
MMDFSLKRTFAQWRRHRRKWPLTRQITIVFTALMIGNALIISTALEYWGEYRIRVALAKLSPEAKRTYEQLDKGASLPSAAAIQQLDKEFKPVQDELNGGFDTALYVMIALASLVTMGLGYLVLGRLGRGLGNVAMAARQISEGDLTARATPVGFASLEEAQLMRDFNAMAVALQRAERELAESTASIAHELRTPLTILRGRLHGIADGVFALHPSEVDGLLYQVEGLGRLVDDLQTLSLANSQRLILASEPTDLAEEVRRVMTTMSPDLTAAGLDPHLDLRPARLLADGPRIRQVISAVLNNACRYAPGSGVLRLSTFIDHDKAILEIADHGPGLPDDAEGRAFDRFWRGEESRGRNTGGSGLGLAVVRTIVEAHAGSATLSNHAGGGVIFEMRLPTSPR